MPQGGAKQWTPEEERIFRENVQAIHNAEWEAFYAISGWKLIRMGWGSFKAWRQARAVAAAGTTKLLSNQMPGLIAQETAAAARVGAIPIQATADSLAAVANQGTLKWIVTEAGTLVVSPHTVRGVEISHAVLSGGRPVLAAGHAEIAAGGGQFVGLSINASSGHFGQGAVDVGKAAFKALGVTF